VQPAKDAIGDLADAGLAGIEVTYGGYSPRQRTELGNLARRWTVGEAEGMSFTLPAALARFVAEKGSIAVAGVSLTVNAVGPESFDVMLIPITLRTTNLGELTPGSPVNLEVDLLARYVARWSGGT